jgi:transposase InsO family protein
MIALICFVLAVLASPFKSNIRLEAENAALRHQLIVLRRKVRGRAQLTNNDRRFFVQLYRWFPSILQVLMIIRPDTLVRWHQAGFRRYWRWKSRTRGGRPQIETELCVLIRRMSVENPLWGAPRIHGELLKLGLELAQSSVAKYMVKRRGPPSQSWRTFLHAPDIAAMDLFVVPTIGFNLLYAFVIIRLDRRDLVWINVTTNPTAEWIAHQITEAFPWDEAPRYLIRDRDRIYGAIVTRRLRAMGIRDKPTASASPWQNGFAERLIGSMRRECTDHIIVFSEAHLRRILRSYACYYNGIRTHRSLDKDDLSPGSADRCHKFTRSFGRTSSPLRSGLGFRYTQRLSSANSGHGCHLWRARDRAAFRARMERSRGMGLCLMAGIMCLAADASAHVGNPMRAHGRRATPFC